MHDTYYVDSPCSKVQIFKKERKRMEVIYATSRYEEGDGDGTLLFYLFEHPRPPPFHVGDTMVRPAYHALGAFYFGPVDHVCLLADHTRRSVSRWVSPGQLRCRRGVGWRRLWGSPPCLSTTRKTSEVFLIIKVLFICNVHERHEHPSVETCCPIVLGDELALGCSTFFMLPFCTTENDSLVRLLSIRSNTDERSGIKRNHTVPARVHREWTARPVSVSGLDLVREKLQYPIPGFGKDI